MAAKQYDNTKKEGSSLNRYIGFDCGTVVLIMQNEFRFKEKILDSPKCNEYMSIQAEHGTTE